MKLSACPDNTKLSLSRFPLSHATSIKPSSLQCVCSCSTTSSHYLRHQCPWANRYVRRTAEIWKKTWNDHEISEVIQFCGVMFFCKQKNMEPKPKKWWRFPWLITMSHLSAIDPCQCSSFHNRSASSHSHPLPGDGSKKVPIIPVTTVMKFMKIILYYSHSIIDYHSYPQSSNVQSLVASTKGSGRSQFPVYLPMISSFSNHFGRHITSWVLGPRAHPLEDLCQQRSRGHQLTQVGPGPGWMLVLDSSKTMVFGVRSAGKTSKTAIWRVPHFQADPQFHQVVIFLEKSFRISRVTQFFAIRMENTKTSEKTNQDISKSQVQFAMETMAHFVWWFTDFFSWWLSVAN